MDINGEGFIVIGVYRGSINVLKGKRAVSNAALL
jgi:hypothetical protein